MTVNLSVTLPPLPSSAVTVIAAVPSPTAVTVRLWEPDATDTVATVVFQDRTVMARVSPSASSNTPASDTCRVSSGSRLLMSAIAETTAGARLAAATVTVNLSVTVPPLPSLAVTVMVAVPALRARTVRLP